MIKRPSEDFLHHFAENGQVDESDLLSIAARKWLGEYFNSTINTDLKPWTPDVAKSFSDVPLHTLLDNEYFLNLGNVLYPGWREILYELWEEKAKRDINLVIFIGAIGLGKCVVGDTQVLTNKGILSIEQLYKEYSSNKMGFYVSTHKQQSRVSEVVDEYVHPVMAIYLNYGFYINGTFNHPLLVNNLDYDEIEYKTLENIQVGDYVAVQIGSNLFGSRTMLPRVKIRKVPNYHLPVTLTKDLAYLMGAFIVSGNFYENRVYFPHNHVSPAYDIILKILSGKYGVFTMSGSRSTVARSNAFYTYFKSLFDTKDEYYQQVIPDIIRRTTRENTIAFLQGVFDIYADVEYDDTESPYTFSVRFQNRAMAQTIQLMLLNLGILSELLLDEEGIYKIRIAYKYVSYFIKKIGFRDKYKQALFNNVLEYKVVTEGIIWVPVFSKDYIGNYKVYDLVVPDEHNFVANGIVNHNTFIASVLLWLNYYYLTTLYDPQKYYSLAPHSVIAFINMSRSERQARKITFGEVWNRFQTQFNKEYFPSAPRMRREIWIERNHISIFPGTSSALSALGYNLWGGNIDEASYLEVVDDSKRASIGAQYDAAEEMYNAVFERMRSRFGRAGKVPGMVVMFSSPRYPDDFLEKAIKQQLDGKRNDVFYKRVTPWDIKPASYFLDSRFTFDATTKKIVDDKSDKNHIYFDVPDDYKQLFIIDPDRGIRDVLARPVESIFPFFRRKDLVHKAFNKDRVNPINEETLELLDSLEPETEVPYFVHVDLGQNRDAVGMGLVHASGIKRVKHISVIHDKVITEEILQPNIVADFVLRHKAKKGEEVDFSAIRDILYELQNRGFFIKLVTYDRFQSVDSIQTLRRAGFIVANLSVDRTSTKVIVDYEQRDGFKKISTDRQIISAMQALKDAIYEERIDIPYHEHLIKEMVSAEYDIVKNKVDHPPNGTIDVLQGLAGAVFNLINNTPMASYEEITDEDRKKYFDDSYYKALESDMQKEGLDITPDTNSDFYYDQFTSDDDIY